jgi:hypothetical protein
MAADATKPDLDPDSCRGRSVVDGWALMSAAPSIQSLGPPPDKHAERIVDLMLAHLHDRRRHLFTNAETVARPEQMGTQKGRLRAAERIRKAMGDTVLDIRIKPATRGRFLLQVIDWGLWRPDTNDLVSDIDPLPLTKVWLAAVKNTTTGVHYRVVTKTTAPLVLTRHAIIRLAQRAEVRTVEDLLAAIRELWLITADLLIKADGGDSWLNPPKGVWRLPLREGGPVAVLKPDVAEGRLICTTILAADMVDDVDGAT